MADKIFTCIAEPAGSAFLLNYIKSNQLNFADIILAAAVVFFTWLGYRKGFINSFFGLAQWVGSLALAIIFYLPLNGWLAQYFLIEDEWQRPLSFAIIFAIAFILLFLVFTTIKKAMVPEGYSYTNKITGLLPGFLTGIAVAILAAKILSTSVWFASPEKENKSYLLSSMVRSCGWLDKKMNTIFNAPGIQKISGANEMAYTESDEFKSPAFMPMPLLEDQLLNMLNTERSKRGLKLLVPDVMLHQAAYYHAADMFTRGYFSHNTPEGINPFDRMKKLGITYRNAGENLAHSYNLDSAHNGLMNSPGHRDNILNKHFCKIGIAVLGSDTKGLMVVQEFSN